MATTENKPGVPLEPLRQYNFRVEVDGYTGYFTACSGLEIQIRPIYYCEGGATRHVRQLAGRMEPPQVTLQYGVIPTHQGGLWTWMMSALGGKPTYKPMSIVHLDHDGNEAMRYNLRNTFPLKVKVSRLEAAGSDASVEEMTFACESIERA
jgi:phage tail-like protein